MERVRSDALAGKESSRHHDSCQVMAGCRDSCRRYSPGDDDLRVAVAAGAPRPARDRPLLLTETRPARHRSHSQGYRATGPY